MIGETWIDQELDQLRRRGLERRTRLRPEGGSLINLSSNDYLDLARSPVVVARAEAALRQYGAGSGASRLVTGTLPCHEELEERLAALKGYPSALLFGTGYMANAGLLPVVLGRNDYAVADKLAHASIVDAAVLSRATLFRFRHNDMNHLSDILEKIPRGSHCLIITESVFSMDGDLAPLRDIADLVHSRDVMLMVDEAHATGIFGPGGAGLVKAGGLEKSVNLCMGTLSKSFGAYGGFVACSEPMRQLLVNRSRPFIFSTAMPPAVAGAALGALDEIEAHPEWGPELLERAELFRKRLKEAGLDIGASESQIIPIMVGDNHKVLALSERLRKNGIAAIAIRPPTVPEGTARLRLSITLANSCEDLERAAEIITRSTKEEGLL